MDLIGVDCRDIIYKYLHNILISDVLISFMHVTDHLRYGRDTIKRSVSISNGLRQYGLTYDQIMSDSDSDSSSDDEAEYTFSGFIIIQ